MGPNAFSTASARNLLLKCNQLKSTFLAPNTPPMHFHPRYLKKQRIAKGSCRDSLFSEVGNLHCHWLVL